MIIEMICWTVPMVLVTCFYIGKRNWEAVITALKVYGCGIGALVIIELMAMAGNVSPLG